jgi:hypothetical protein
MAKKKPGQPLKLNKQIIKKVSEAVSIGTPMTAAAIYGGIAYQSHLNYYGAGEAESARLADDPAATPDPTKRLFVEYFDAINQAKADAAVTWSSVLNNAANVDPRWAFEMLRKWYPETYGEPTKKMEITGADGEPLLVKLDR